MQPRVLHSGPFPGGGKKSRHQPWGGGRTPKGAEPQALATHRSTGERGWKSASGGIVSGSGTKHRGPVLSGTSICSRCWVWRSQSPGGGAGGTDGCHSEGLPTRDDQSHKRQGDHPRLTQTQGAGPLSASQEGRRGCGPGPIPGTPDSGCRHSLYSVHLRGRNPPPTPWILLPRASPDTKGSLCLGHDHPRDRNTPSRDSSRTHCPMWDRSTGATLPGSKSQWLLATPTSQSSPAVPRSALCCTLLPQRGPLPCSARLLHTALAPLAPCPHPSNLVHRQRPRPASTQAHPRPGPPAKPNLLDSSFPPTSLASP
ncbi:uncharacterized protein LOC134760774 [Pongo abelii]|uniref:uncharacterized protein LOC134760774 n=1 Tax=Pongo abelii TaxID=9601 RepID=UPI003007EF65